MKKTFKQSFGVQGSPAQLQAFKEWAESVGWVWQLIDNSFKTLWFCGAVGSDWLPLHIANDSRGAFWAIVLNSSDEHITPTYHLPAQWAEAMQAASAVEIVWEKGDKIWTGNEVREVSDTNGSILYLVGGNFVYATDIRPATPEEIEAARKPRFKAGDLALWHVGETLIAITKDSYGKNFSGICIRGDKKGEHREDWYAENFSLPHEPVTL